MGIIGIYGDSWADPNHGHDFNPQLAEQAWCKRFDQADIYAKGGSSIYFGIFHVILLFFRLHWGFLSVNF